MKKTDKWTIYAILYRNVIIFYRQKIASLFEVHEKLKACRNSKGNFLSSCFIGNESRAKIVWLRVAS